MDVDQWAQEGFALTRGLGMIDAETRRCQMPIVRRGMMGGGVRHLRCIWRGLGEEMIP